MQLLATKDSVLQYYLFLSERIFSLNVNYTINKDGLKEAKTISACHCTETETKAM